MRVTVDKSAWDYIQRSSQARHEKNRETSFASGITQAANSAAGILSTNDMLNRLSANAVQVLKELKNGSEQIELEDWQGLMDELKQTGAITETDYLYTYVDKDVGRLFPYVPGVPTAVDWRVFAGIEGTENTETKMDALLETRWPGNPLDMLDNLALYMRKWVGILSISTDDEGNPGSLYSGPYAEHEASCMRVSKMVRELMAEV